MVCPILGMGVTATDKDKVLKYSMQLSMLKQLLYKKLITEEEYTKVLKKLMKDYGVISGIPT